MFGDNCHFPISRTAERSSIPIAGNIRFALADEAERQKYEERLKNPEG